MAMRVTDTFRKLHWIRDLERAYDVRIEAVIHMRSVVGIRADGRSWIVKNLGSSVYPKRVHAIAKALEQLHRQGTPVCPILRNQSGRFFTQSAGNLYIVQPWIEGRHVDFRHPEERMKAVQAIGTMHSRPVVLSKKWSDLLQMPALNEKYWHRLRRCQKILQTHKTTWSRLLDQAAWNRIEQQALQSIHSLKKRLLASNRSMTTVSFCHRDLAPHNLLIGPSTKVTLIDFDLAGFDVTMHDLYQVINHTLYLHGWDATDVISIVQTYERTAGMTHRDRELLYELLLFPSLVTREMYDYSRGIKSEQPKMLDCIATRFRWASEIEEAKREWLMTEGKRMFTS
jgi:CotS family spore coat protein